MRKVLVTGANKGIGLAIVKAILDEHDDTFVYLGSRDAARGKAAAESLGKADRVSALEIDVASEASVKAAAKHVSGPLYGVVNNAGIGRGELADVLQTNVYGIHYVCEAFLPLLDPKEGRIVNVTSASGPNYVSAADAERKKFLLDKEITWPRLDAFMKECIAAKAGDAYGLSKACANVYTMALARDHANLAINACTPGFIDTDLTQHYAVSQGKTPAELGMKPPSAGAKAPVFLLFGALEGNGRFYGSDAQRSPLDRYRSPGSPPYTGD